MKTMQGCCCVNKPDPCNLAGDPPNAMQALIINGGVGVWVGGPHLLPNEGTLADLKATITGGRNLGADCNYYWSNDLGGGKRFVVGAFSQILWALDPSIGGDIRNAIIRLWAANPKLTILNWNHYDTTRLFVYGNILGDIIGNANVENAP